MSSSSFCHHTHLSRLNRRGTGVRLGILHKCFHIPGLTASATPIDSIVWLAVASTPDGLPPDGLPGAKPTGSGLACCINEFPLEAAWSVSGVIGVGLGILHYLFNIQAPKPMIQCSVLTIGCDSSSLSTTRMREEISGSDHRNVLMQPTEHPSPHLLLHCGDILPA